VGWQGAQPPLYCRGFLEPERLPLSIGNGRRHPIARTQKAKTIIIDPPWNVGQTGRRGANQHYELMTIEEIKALPIADLVDKNAHAYLWCYPATRRVAEEILEHWGFRFKDEFIWGKDQYGLGNYFRHAHETLLLGVRGRLAFQFHGQRSFAMLPRRDHSHKPEEVRELVRRCSPGPYLELFSRTRPPTNDDWLVWGLEAPGGSDVTIPGYPVPPRDQEANS
jgi:N6-adenosine-specific RNA methylase IME4